MASKYDGYWTAHLDEISAGLQAAASGAAAVVERASVRRLGDRQSWYGVAEVCGREMTRSSMAHATSLGQIVAASGMCAAWPGRTFRFAIGATGVLTVTMRISRPAAPAAAGDTPEPPATGPRNRLPGQHPASATRAQLSAEARRRTPITSTCCWASWRGGRRTADAAGLHRRAGLATSGRVLLLRGRRDRANGSGRVVRVGTHALTPTSQTTLWDRLSQHRGHLKGRNSRWRQSPCVSVPAARRCRSHLPQ